MFELWGDGGKLFSCQDLVSTISSYFEGLETDLVLSFV